MEQSCTTLTSQAFIEKNSHQKIQNFFGIEIWFEA